MKNGNLKLEIGNWETRISKPEPSRSEAKIPRGTNGAPSKTIPLHPHF